MNKVLFIGALASVICSSCAVFDRDEPIPAYVRIDDISVQVSDPSLQGTSNDKISDAWVFINDNLQGIYELPAVFPVLDTGEVSIKVGAGIKVNGIGSTRNQYPFYLLYEAPFGTKLTAGETTTLAPSVQYDPLTDYTYVEDFEDTFYALDSVSGNQATIKRTVDANKVFEGNGALEITFENGASILKMITTPNVVLPTDATPVYLELNYSCNVLFAVGVEMLSPTSGYVSETAIYLKATTENSIPVWNKIYIELTNEVNQVLNQENARIFFYSEVSSSVENNQILIDNIKLVSAKQ